jgi:hypothetical protein
MFLTYAVVTAGIVVLLVAPDGMIGVVQRSTAAIVHGSQGKVYHSAGRPAEETVETRR